MIRCTILILLGLMTAAPAVAEDTPHKTDWLYKAKWGVMYHFTPRFQGVKTAQEWNKVIDEFDVDGLARQLKELGAGYLLITSRHGNGYPIAPNSVIEKSNPGHCPKRDLIADLAVALEKQGLGLMLYYSTGMGIEKPKTAKHTAAVLEEWSKRYGKSVKGWWLDNNVGDQSLQKMISDGARAGNPDTLIGFSPPKMQRRNSPYEDYTAGNTHAPGYARCNGRFVDGLQWHMLSYLANSWGGYSKPGLRRNWSVGKVVGFTHKFVSRGGVVTWDVKPARSGLIDPFFVPILKKIGESVANIKR